jgi:putative nucleotidyltransferase with HDIG domain
MEFMRVPIRGLTGMSPIGFPVFLEGTGANPPVLYVQEGAPFDLGREKTLVDGGVEAVLIPRTHRASYLNRIENQLESLSKDPSVPLESRVTILHEAAVETTEELFRDPLNRVKVRRCERMVRTQASVILREPEGFLAIRKVMRADPTLTTHSVSVSVLATATAARLFPDSVSKVSMAGTAGLLHDIGRVGFVEKLGQMESSAHCLRGERILQELGLPGEVVQAAALHHERMDGTGFPNGFKGDQLDPVTQIVALADCFDGIRVEHEGRIGVFDCFQILVNAYRGCFNERHFRAFLKAFGT